jgi:hypothetical protein
MAPRPGGVISRDNESSDPQLGKLVSGLPSILGRFGIFPLSPLPDSDFEPPRSGIRNSRKRSGGGSVSRLLVRLARSETYPRASAHSRHGYAATPHVPEAAQAAARVRSAHGERNDAERLALRTSREPDPTRRLAPSVNPRSTVRRTHGLRSGVAHSWGSQRSCLRSSVSCVGLRRRRFSVRPVAGRRRGGPRI